MGKVFREADIMLPTNGTDLSRWAVVACDQFTSEQEYWEQAADYVGKAPSTLSLIHPTFCFRLLWGWGGRGAQV